MLATKPIDLGLFSLENKNTLWHRGVTDRKPEWRLQRVHSTAAVTRLTIAAAGALEEVSMHPDSIQIGFANNACARALKRRHPSRNKALPLSKGVLTWSTSSAGLADRMHQKVQGGKDWCQGANNQPRTHQFMQGAAIQAAINSTPSQAQSHTPSSPAPSHIKIRLRVRQRRTNDPPDVGQVSVA